MNKRVVTISLWTILGTALGCGGDIDTGGPGDGDRIVFSSGYVFVRDQDIFVADQSNYEIAKQLTFSGSNREPALSADGSTIVYVHEDRGLTSLRKISSGGGGDSELVAASSERQVMQPALNGNGSQVVFVSKYSSNAVLMVINSDGSGEKQVQNSEYDNWPTFYSGGQYLMAITGSSWDFIDLVKVTLNSGVRDTLSVKISGQLSGRAVVSPDGKKIAFEAKEDGERPRIYVVSAGGGMPEAIASLANEERFPTWVTNNRLGFVSSDGGIFNVYEKELGSDAILVVPGADQASYGGLQ